MVQKTTELGRKCAFRVNGVRLNMLNIEVDSENTCGPSDDSHQETFA